MAQERGHLDGRIEQNVRSVRELRRGVARSFGSHTHFLSRMVRHLARPASLYLLLLSVGGWIALNLCLSAVGRKPLDPPPFFWVQGVVGMAALVTAVLVLIGQNRQAELSERRADLDVQVNLLTAQRAAKLIALLEELRRDLPNVENRQDDEAAALAKPEKPEDVSRVVHESMRDLGCDLLDEPGLK